MKRYNPKQIEPKWQNQWEQDGIYRASEDTTKPKRYVLEYFPYPSGAAMHVGHVRNYTIGDAIARYHRMQGDNVLHPMGWDSFGLPAENYAIKNNISPREAIERNTSKFKQQLSQMGFSYDWSREVDSSQPEYYRWTQWFFKLLFDRGLAYQKDSLQWWCETDKTVLANEQVEAGKCWRCGNTVTKKPLKQWFFKITDYADRLVEDLEQLDWSDSIKAMQRNWIGKSKGAEVDFKVVDSDETITVYTTRPDTLFGATFMVLAPEHSLVAAITAQEQKESVEAYVKQAQAKSDIERQETSREKTGVFTGAYALNPVNNEKIPVWIADYVLTGYGTGAIMAVPAHDERDYEFAQKYTLPIRQVIMPDAPDPINPPADGIEEVTRDTVVVHLKDKSTGKFALLDWHGSLEGITTAIMGGVEQGQTAEDAVRAEIQEEAGFDTIEIEKESMWVTSDRYFASHKNQNRRSITRAFLATIDSTESQKSIDPSEQKIHTLKWVNENEVMEALVPAGQKLIWAQLQEQTALSGEGKMMNSGEYDELDSAEAREKIVADLAKNGTGREKVNYKIRDWLISRQRYWGAPIPIVHCKKDGAVAVPEDQLPVVLPELTDFQPTGNGSALAGATEWINTTCPQCGGPAQRETDTMDGFACSSWYFLRFADPHNDKEPFSKEKAKFWMPVDDYIGGAEHAVMHLLYARMWTKVMFDAGLIEFNEPFKALRNHGMILAPDGRKMSKSWGNVISPDEIIDQGYGADAIRLMELFIGPWDQEAAWSVEGMGGCFRFLQRVWTLHQEYLGSAFEQSSEQKDVTISAHKAIKRVTEDLQNMGFNTAIAALMEYTNQLYKIKADQGFTDKIAWKHALCTLTQLLAPFAPHITEELWQELGKKGSVHQTDWPQFDNSYLVSDTVNVVVQVNGKVRASVNVAADASEDMVVAEAKADKKVAEYISGNSVKKTIYVTGRLINFVV